MTTVYLAWGPAGSATLERHRHDAPVDLLVAFQMLPDFLKVRARYNVGRWCLDSGAFIGWSSGRAVRLEEYLAAARDTDADEVVSLDVIGDADASWRNYVAMRDVLPNAIPTFHHGSTEADLRRILEAEPPKIAIGGSARLHESHRAAFVREVFARAWPIRVHGFACASRRLLDVAPFDSVDAASWTYAPRAMGMWAGFSGSQIAIKGLNTTNAPDLWAEVVEHQRRSRWAAGRWARELERVREVPA